MVRKELIKRSPLRILEKSTHGGVGKGNIGVIASKKGVGKTACLVHIATDQLFSGKHIIHLSFSQNPNHIVWWYENIFKEIAKNYKLASAMDVHDEIIKNRLIINFEQKNISVKNIEEKIKIIIEKGNFNVETIIVDGYDFEKSDINEFKEFKNFALNNSFEFWFSATLKNCKTNEIGIPEILLPYINDISVLICLEPKNDFIHLNLIKDHNEKIKTKNMHLKLDPHTLLIAEENQIDLKAIK
jgi:hypothetical protein